MQSCPLVKKRAPLSSGPADSEDRQSASGTHRDTTSSGIFLHAAPALPCGRSWRQGIAARRRQRLAAPWPGPWRPHPGVRRCPWERLDLGLGSAAPLARGRSVRPQRGEPSQRRVHVDAEAGLRAPFGRCAHEKCSTWRVGRIPAAGSRREPQRGARDRRKRGEREDGTQQESHGSPPGRPCHTIVEYCRSLALWRAADEAGGRRRRVAAAGRSVPPSFLPGPPRGPRGSSTPHTGPAGRRRRRL